jgi:maleate isomerase
MQAMAPDDVVVHAARVPFGAMAAGGEMDSTIPLAPVRAFADPPYVDEAAELLAAAPLAAIGFGFTSSAYVIGERGEAEMITRLRERTRGIPVTATCAAAVAGLRSLGVSRLGLVSPPWFDSELVSLGAAYFAGQGFEVVWSAAADLTSDQSQIDPAGLFEWARTPVPDDVAGLFIGGNGFRAVGVIDALEAEIGRPVITANQALFWSLLRAAGSTEPIAGYGRLLAV